MENLAYRLAIWVLATVLGCAVAATGQVLPTTFANLVQVSSPAAFVTKLEDPIDVLQVTDDTGAAAPSSSALAGGTLSDAGQINQPALNPFAAVPRHKNSTDNFQWKPAFAEYSFEIAIQHAWRFVHEPGTRDATGNGPWLKDWIDSIGETRGWDDGDGWHAGYVGHPLNGAIYGFIEQQNDPKYRQVEWGDGHIYWMSRLRATAFAAVGSTQWTLGPVSEASLGNVQ